MAVAKSKTICNTQNRRSLQKVKQFAQAKIALSTQCKAKTKRRQNIAPSTPSVEEPQHCIFDEICQFFVSIAVAKSKTICTNKNCKDTPHCANKLAVAMLGKWQQLSAMCNFLDTAQVTKPHHHVSTKFTMLWSNGCPEQPHPCHTQKWQQSCKCTPVV